MRRCSEAEQANPLASFYACNSQTSVTDDARAEQRRRLQIVEVGKREDQIRAGKSILGEAAIHGASRRRRRITAGFAAMLAVGATPIRTAPPGHADPRAKRPIPCC